MGYVNIIALRILKSIYQSFKLVEFLSGFLKKNEKVFFVLDTINPNCFILISTVDTFGFLLNLLLLDIPDGFQPIRVYHWFCANFAASDWLLGFCKRHSDWLNFLQFPGYQIKIKLICRFTKIGNQALISISTLQEFLALDYFYDLN